jgi:hypothetical protein
VASRTPSQQLTDDDFRSLGLADEEDEEAQEVEVERVSWEEHFAYPEEEWQAGEHCSIFAPTDGGKTHLIRHGLLPLWQKYPVLWLLYKPRDSTIRGLGHKVKAFPSWDKRVHYTTRELNSDRWEKDPEWFVLQLPAFKWSPDGKKESESWKRAREVAGSAMDRAYREGGWVLVIDEVRAFSDADSPSLDLKAPMANAWQRGRSQPLTMIAATQAPARAPYEMYDQARFCYLGRTLDVGRWQRIAEIGGNTELIKRLLPTIEHREFLFVDRRSGYMQIVSAPPG